MTCKGCDADKESKQGQWWHLTGYFGFSGRFCPDCYDMISHDSYGQPCRPADYTFMLLRNLHANH